MEVKIKLSDKDDKRYTAIFYDKDGEKLKTTHFGFAEVVEGVKKYGSTFIDHKDEQKKDAWIARHSVRGSFNEFMTASSLARYILWNKKTLSASIDDYKKIFKLY